ncbi:hypothetical protein KUCAC02_016215, partial [Chaenocephalus aceratus]
ACWVTPGPSMLLPMPCFGSQGPKGIFLPGYADKLKLPGWLTAPAVAGSGHKPLLSAALKHDPADAESCFSRNPGALETTRLELSPHNPALQCVLYTTQITGNGRPKTFNHNPTTRTANMGEAPYGANMFLWCWAGWDHTDAVGLHVASIRADDNKGLVSIVYMKEDKDGRNNNREGEKEERTA